MRVKINGRDEEIGEKTVMDLLKTREIEPQMVSVEVNSRILNREEYSQTIIKEEDRIEFLFFMGGGYGSTFL